MNNEPTKINRTTLSIFAPILILTGIAGFLVPTQYSMTSGAAPYNLFHILFGAIGLLIVSLRQESLAIGFNIIFGLIDLYQLLASFAGLTPKQYFLWTPVDDLLHAVLGVGLVAVGVYAIRSRKLL